MKSALKWLALPLACLNAVPPAAAADTTILLLADRDAIQAAATSAAADALKLDKSQLHLVLDRTKRQGEWAFVTARMRNAAGKRFDYAGTSLHQAAQAGGLSDLCAALLRLEDGHWKLVQIAVGPTDQAWDGWAAQYQAPEALFQ